MDLKQLRFWQRHHQPTTIVIDPYCGTYSDGEWLAFPLDTWDVPKDIDAGDMECCIFWKEYDQPVGKGSTPDEALNNLKEVVSNMLHDSNR